MTEVTPEEILSMPVKLEKLTSTASQKSSTWGTLFWLVALTPVGWYWVWKKTDWPNGLKMAVTIISALLFMGLLIETELVSTQVTSQLTNLGG